MSPLTRRQLLMSTAATATGVAIGRAGASGRTRRAASPRLPNPATSGIDHIVVVMMENRSFDHYLGWLPGADGKQAGLSYTGSDGVEHSTHHLAAPHGCGFNDPDHSYEGGRVEFNDGACDGWLRAGDNDELSIGYYEAA